MRMPRSRLSRRRSKVRPVHDDRQVGALERLAQKIGRVERERVDRPGLTHRGDLSQAESVRIPVKAGCLTVERDAFRSRKRVDESVCVLKTFDVDVAHGGAAAGGGTRERKRSRRDSPPLRPRRQRGVAPPSGHRDNSRYGAPAVSSTPGPYMLRTKVVCTIGPASADPGDRFSRMVRVAG